MTVRGVYNGDIMDEQAARRALEALISEYRTRCLWFLRPDFEPSSDAERLRVLNYIARYGDRDGHRRAALLRRWFSPISSATSVGS